MSIDFRGFSIFPAAKLSCLLTFSSFQFFEIVDFSPLDKPLKRTKRDPQCQAVTYTCKKNAYNSVSMKTSNNLLINIFVPYDQHTLKRALNMDSISLIRIDPTKKDKK